MGLATVTVTGTYEDAGGNLLTGKTLRFKPLYVFGDDGIIVPTTSVKVVTDSETAEFSVDLLTSDVAEAYVRYQVEFHNQTRKKFDLTDDVTEISLEDLINAYDSAQDPSAAVMLLDHEERIDDLEAAGASGVTDGDKGDVVVSGGGLVWDIDAGAVGNTEIAAGIDAVKIADGSITNTEFQYLNGVTSNIQDQIDAAAGATSLDELSDVAITSAASGDFLRHNGTNFVDATIQAGDIPASVDAAKIADGSISNTEFQHLNNVSSNIQTQIDGKSSTSHNHDATYQPLAAVLTNTTASFTTADETKLDAIEALADVTDAVNVGSSIHGAAAKTTPVDADTVPTIDSEASNVLKKVSWTNIKAFLKTYFDTLYSAVAHNHSGTYQPLDSDLTTIAGLTATTDSFIQSKASAWASRTVAQVKSDLGLTGTNSGDQTSIVGITGTLAEFNTAISDANIIPEAGGTFTGDISVPNEDYDATAWNGSNEVPTKNAVRDKIEAIVVGGGFGTEEAQDAVGAMVDTSLVYADATPLLSRAALTGDVTAAEGANATTIANDAVTNAKAANMAQATIKGRQSGSGTGDPEDLTATQARTILNVEDGADVTDATNVDAAGAVMNADTSTAAMSFVVDEDDMTSNSATKVPTQQSVKAYVDANVGGGSVTISGTPTAGQAAQWTDADTIEGVDVVNFSGLSAKSALVNDDEFLLADSEDTGAPKKTLWSSIKAVLKTYFDTLYQPVDSDLTTIAGLTATTDSFIQSKSSAWAARTVAQVKSDLGLTGTNSGDQTTIVGITGTKAEFDTAVTDGNFAYQSDLASYQPVDSDLTTIAGLTATTDSFLQSKSSAWAARTITQVKSDLGLTGTNSGDQTSIVGITGTKAQFDTAVSDGNIVYVGDTLASPVITSPQISFTAAHGSDDTYTGFTIAGMNAGATIAQWEAVYMGGSAQWLLADANGSGTYPARGLAVAAYVDTNAATILVQGTVRNDAWNWTPQGAIYLSGTPGALTQTAPSTSGDKVQIVGWAITADIAYFNFDSVYVTLT